MTLEFRSLENALQELQELHDQTPNDLEVHLLLSKCYHQLGNESAALVHNMRAQDLHVLAQKGDRSDELSDSGTETAKELELQVMGTHKESLGADDPDMLTSISKLESVLEEQRKYEEEEVKYEAESGYEDAEAKDKEAEATYRRVLEASTTVNDLGSVLFRQGKYEEAEAMYQRALEAREKVLGQEHFYTLTSVSQLGLVLEGQGRYKEAEAMHRQALEGREKVLGPEDPDTLASMHLLAQFLTGQDRVSEALPLYQRAYSGFHKILGEDNPTTVECRDKLRELQERHTYK
jgi:tetratricopeptide (TPR) repeat protein